MTSFSRDHPTKAKESMANSAIKWKLVGTNRKLILSNRIYSNSLFFGSFSLKYHTFQINIFLSRSWTDKSFEMTVNCWSFKFICSKYTITTISIAFQSRACFIIFGDYFYETSNDYIVGNELGKWNKSTFRYQIAKHRIAGISIK